MTVDPRLKSYTLDPAGDIPESELRLLARTDASGGAVVPITTPITVTISLAVCPTTVCTKECPVTIA